MWRGLTDKQWEKVKPHLPKLKNGRKGGRPWASERSVFEGTAQQVSSISDFRT